MFSGDLPPETPKPSKDGDFAFRSSVAILNVIVILFAAYVFSNRSRFDVFSVTVDDEQVLAPCEIFTVSTRVPQILEVIENCPVLYSDNPLDPRAMGTTSQVVEKGTKLFYTYVMKQDLGMEEHRVLYEVPTLGKGKWLPDTNKSGQPVLRKTVRIWEPNSMLILRIRVHYTI